MQYGDMALVLDLLGEVEEIVNFRWFENDNITARLDVCVCS
jgi:hypothetical protein